MPVRPRALLVILMLALTGFVAAGCGGSSSSGDDANAVLKDTFSGDKSIKSARLALGVDIQADGLAGLGGPIAIKLTGPFQNLGKDELPAFDLALNANAAGQGISAGVISTGTKGFVEVLGTAYALPDDVFAQFKQGFEKSQAESRQKHKDATSLASLGIDPQNWVVDPKVEGDAKVGGTDTTHVSAGVDVDRLLDDVNKLITRASSAGLNQNGRTPQQLTPAQKDTIKKALKDVSFDVYSGKDDRILRKLDLSLKVDVPKAQRSQAGGIKTADVSVTVQLTDVNRPQAITPPANAKPYDQLQGALGRIGLGATSGGGSGSGGSSSGAGGNSAEKLQAYTDCVTTAAGDNAKAADCAKLLR